MAKQIVITESQYNQLKESLLNEAQQVVDNFNLIANLLKFSSTDEYYYVQLMQRFKDNPNGNKNVGNYHGGAWYLGGMRIHSAQELLSNKLAIVSMCKSMNARAYITINSRSDAATDREIARRKRRYPATDARNKYADQIVAAEPKSDLSDPAFANRVGYFADVDEPKNAYLVMSKVNFRVTGADTHADLIKIDANGAKINGKKLHKCNSIFAYPKDAQELSALQSISPNIINVWDGTKNIFNKNNVPISGEYVTSSGGLHIIGQDFSIPEFKQLQKDLMIFDRDVYMGRLATVHLNIDGKLILYADVNTKGY